MNNKDLLRRRFLESLGSHAISALSPKEATLYHKTVVKLTKQMVSALASDQYKKARLIMGVTRLVAAWGDSGWTLRFGRNRLAKPPGFRVLTVAEFFCSPKTIDQVFEPLVSDWQEEYFAALNENRWFKARWVSIRYMWKALLAFGLSKLFAAVRAFSTKR